MLPVDLIVFVCRSISLFFIHIRNINKIYRIYEDVCGLEIQLLVTKALATHFAILILKYKLTNSKQTILYY